MQYNRKHLVIRNAPDKNPVVIATCYLPEIAETICKALTEHSANLQSDISQHTSIDVAEHSANAETVRD